MSGPGQVKGHNEAFSHFEVPGRLDELQRAHTHPKCSANVQEGYCVRIMCIHKKVEVKVRSQLITKKISHKRASRHMFSVSFCKQMSMVIVIWPYITSSNLTFDGGQVKARSNFQINIFIRKTHVACSELPEDSKYVICFPVRCVELSKIAN